MIFMPAPNNSIIRQPDFIFPGTRLLNDLTSKPGGTTTKVPDVYCITHQQGAILGMSIMGFLLSFLFSFNSLVQIWFQQVKP